MFLVQRKGVKGLIGGFRLRKPGASAPPLEPDTAAALPTANSETAIHLNNTANTNRYSLTNVVPATDWTLGFWMKTVVRGIVFMSGPSTSIFTSNNHLAVFAELETIVITGKDNAGVSLGSSSANPANSSSRGLGTRFNVPGGGPVFATFRKVGNLIQIILKWPGHAPVKVAEEFTTFGACTSQGCYFGQDRSGSFRWNGQLRKPFFVSYALTDTQIDAVARGTDPATFGTPSATDWHFPTVGNLATWTGALNSINATRFLTTGYAEATGLGLVVPTNSVFITPNQDGKVYQRVGGSAVVPLSGIYLGADAPIQVLPIDWATNVSVGNWTTVAAAPTGGVWSGSITLPARNGWYKFQTRKVIGGTPSTDVMTTSIRVGVGEVIMLLGQSSMDNIGSGASGSDTVTPNGMWSESKRVGYLINGVGKEDVNVVGTANVGGEVEIQTQYSHGRRTGERLRVHFVGGTVEANGEWTITVTANNRFRLNGSVYANAFTSGGIVFYIAPKIVVANSATQTGIAGGHAVIGNHLSTQAQCPVMIINRAVGQVAIEYFSSYTYAGVGTGGAVTVLHSKHAEKIGSVHWLHGHANIGDTTYFSDGGNATDGYTGWGKLGTLIDFFRAEFPNNDWYFGLCAFSSIGGVMAALSPTNVFNFRMGYQDWVVRKNAAGDDRVFFTGFFHDHQPMSENSVVLNSHRNPPDYRRIAARIPHSYAWRIGANANDAVGPRIIGVSRASEIIILNVEQNGGTALRVLRDGAKASGFEVSANNFATKLPISSITFPNATQIQITLATNPGGPVRVRYQWGYPGDYTAGVPFTPRITGAANNGSGLIRITTALAQANQDPNGHGLQTNDWCMIKDVAGTVEANGIWQVTRIDAENFDLIGSTFTNAYTGVLYGTGTPAVVKEIGVPVYDNRTIGGYDTNGAPLQPTSVPLLAA